MSTPILHIPKVGVGVLLTDQQGRILLTLRKRPPEANHWSIVGGKLDYFEPLEACAIREARDGARDFRKRSHDPAAKP